MTILAEMPLMTVMRDTPCSLTVAGSLGMLRMMQEKINIYNGLLRERIEPMDQVSRLDLNPFFYDDPGDIGTRQNFRDVFVADGLHLQDEAYPQMAAFLAQGILDRLK